MKRTSRPSDHKIASHEMRAFWDTRARENALYFVNNELEFSDPDEDEFWASGVEVLDRMLDLFGLTIRSEDRVIEIGCGMGRLTRPLATRASHVIGVDVSPEMLERCRAALADLQNIELVLGSGRDLTGIPDSSAEVVYSFVVFQHIPDPAITCGYIREMGRVLRPGGWALFQLSEDPEVHISRSHERPTVRGRINEMLGRQPRGCRAPQWTGSSVSRADTAAALAAGGLVLEGTAGDGTQFCLIHARKPG